MLQLSGTLVNCPVMSLRTGTVVATTLRPILNPTNLKVEGFFCQDSMDRHQELVMVYQDIRDIISQGFVINDYDVLTSPQELVRLKDVFQLNFELLGKLVVTTDKERIGKVSDYAIETTTMFVQKLYVTQSLLKSFTGGNLGIDRTQIVEITDKKIIIQPLEQKVPAHASAVA